MINVTNKRVFFQQETLHVHFLTGSFHSRLMLFGGNKLYTTYAMLIVKHRNHHNNINVGLVSVGIVHTMSLNILLLLLGVYWYREAADDGP